MNFNIFIVTIYRDYLSPMNLCIIYFYWYIKEYGYKSIHTESYKYECKLIPHAAGAEGIADIKSFVNVFCVHCPGQSILRIVSPCDHLVNSLCKIIRVILLQVIQAMKICLQVFTHAFINPVLYCVT